MKHLRTMLACVVLMLACVLTFAACNDTTEPAETTPDTTPAATEAQTVVEEETLADTVAGEVETTVDTQAGDVSDETEEVTEALVAGDYFDADPDTVILINTPEDLMNFANAINAADPYADYLWDETVIFGADIDMTGYEWTPLQGCIMDCVTFDGQGHTISNLTFKDYRVAIGTPAAEMGCGFVDVATGELTFKDLTFDTCTVNAYERAVGNFVGLVITSGSHITFENCKSINFTVNGWMDRNNEVKDDPEAPTLISFRQSGFIGHLMGGTVSFENCHVENIKLSAYHNMAGFVGYDGTGTVDEYCFTDCSVKNAEFTFSYGMGLSEGKTVESFEKKYVSVFFNGADWVDKIDACVDLGNTYESISYYDWYNDNKEYTPIDFRSWDGATEEEAA